METPASQVIIFIMDCYYNYFVKTKEKDLGWF